MAVADSLAVGVQVMSSKMRRGTATAVVGMAILLSTTFDHVRADGEEPEATSDSGTPQPFADYAPSPADIDPILHAAPSGDHDARVGAILAAHPDRDVLICLAGCGSGGPKIVALRQHGVAIAATAMGALPSRELRPSSGEAPRRDTPDPSPGQPAPSALPAVGDVICLAGCVGNPGEVVQQAVRLTWIDQNASEELRTALRGLARRLIAQDDAVASRMHEGSSGRHAWMSDDARRMLIAPRLSPLLAALVRSATTMVERPPQR